jgi:UDP:flavonoid glycosyltransferase YjiC (YdhE family)
MAEKTPQGTMVESPDLPRMRLNVSIMLLGSRGDLQPTLEIAKLLRFQHGHRVRIATHPVHAPKIESAGIEFFSIGDKTDPKEMQKRRLLTGDELKSLFATIKDEFHEMGRRWWHACIGDERDDFVADAIIANMQCYPHTSAAARMGIPLHMLGTNPRTPTKYLPHSQYEKLAKGGGKFENRLSFWLFDW